MHLWENTLETYPMLGLFTPLTRVVSRYLCEGHQLAGTCVVIIDEWQLSYN